MIHSIFNKTHSTCWVEVLTPQIAVDTTYIIIRKCILIPSNSKPVEYDRTCGIVLVCIKTQKPNDTINMHQIQKLYQT